MAEIKDKKETVEKVEVNATTTGKTLREMLLEHLVAQAQIVAEHRELVGVAREEVQKAQKALSESPQAEALSSATAQYVELSVSVSTEEEKLRALGEEFFGQTGEKKPLSGLEVKEFSVMDVDPKAIRGWLGKNAPAFLIVNEKALKSSADTLANLGAPIRFTPTTKCYLSKDLSQYLTTPEPEPAPEAPEESKS